MNEGMSGRNGSEGGDERGEDVDSPAPDAAEDSNPVGQDLPSPRGLREEPFAKESRASDDSEPPDQGQDIDDGSRAPSTDRVPNSPRDGGDGREYPDGLSQGSIPRRTDRRAMRRHATRQAGDSRRGPNLFQAHSVCHFLSTSRTPKLLGTLVDRCLAANTRLDHVLLHGAPGCGTALLAQALINDFAPGRVVEIDAALGCDSEVIRRSVDEVGRRGVLYIRHIDALDAECENALASALGERPVRFKRRGEQGPTDPSETDLDRAIAASANDLLHAPESAPPDFTLLATAHLISHVGYVLRTRFQHMFHLRDDPKALRNVALRALRRKGSITVHPDSFPQLERVLATLSDSCEPIVQAILLRAESEDSRQLSAETIRTVLEEDLALRISDEAYAASLRRHLAGRRIDAITPDEVRRVADETGWGTVAAYAALSMMAREDSRRRNP